MIEVAGVEEGTRTLRGQLELEALGSLLGGTPQEVPGATAVVLDVSPTLAVRVDRVHEVADVAGAPFFLLPPGLGEALPKLVRGALLHREALYLELSPEALRSAPGAACAPRRPLFLLEEAPERALVFRSQGRWWGLPLPLVSQVVVAREESFCPLPPEEGPVLGFYFHAQSLWPVFSVGRLLSSEGAREPHLIFCEAAGQGLALCAESVLGVVEGLTPTGDRGAFVSSGMPTGAVFLDLQRMFS